MRGPMYAMVRGVEQRESSIEMSSRWERLLVLSLCCITQAPERHYRAGTWHCITIIQSVFEWTDKVKICKGLTGTSFPVNNPSMNPFIRWSTSPCIQLITRRATDPAGIPEYKFFFMSFYM